MRNLEAAFMNRFDESPEKSPEKQEKQETSGIHEEGTEVPAVKETGIQNAEEIELVESQDV